jgi:nucleotide-binding universal stress UspA family protein
MNESDVKILVPLDGSHPGDDTLIIASSLADVIGAGMIDVLHVSAEPMSELDLKAAVRISDDMLPRVRLHHATGPAAPAIADIARAIEASAIVISTHGRTGDASKLAGHVALGVLEQAPCPVYVVRSALDSTSQAHRLRHLRRVLVPLDRSSEAIAATRIGAAVAEAAHATLHLVNVVCPDPALRRAPLAPVYTDQPQHEMPAWADEFFREAFATGACPVSVECSTALRVGDPGERIAAYAEEIDCDLIVMAWAGSMAPGRAAVVRTLLARARCPLLFVRVKQDGGGAVPGTTATTRT